MAAPTQQFPPWLTPVPSVITDAAGVPIATEISVEYLPLTYLGPSIPLGSIYTFGGSTEPPSIVNPFETATPTSTTSISTTATPTSVISTTSESISSSSTASSSSLSSLSSSSSLLSASSQSTIPSSTTSAQPTSSTTAATGAMSSNGLSKGQLIGVIIASILGLIFLFVLILATYLWCKGRSNRKSRTRFAIVTPIDDEYMVVPRNARTPGEGSPRHSGEEADPFLQSSTSGGATGAMAQVGRNGASRVPPPTDTVSTGSSNSGYGVMLDRPSIGVLPTSEEGHEENRRGSVLTQEQLRALDEESVLPPGDDAHNGEYSGAYAYSSYPSLTPPPRLHDPAAMGGRTSPFVKTTPSIGSQKSDGEEDATLLTARRVKVEDLLPRSTSRSPLDDHPAPISSSGLLGSLGLGNLANLSRLSWFRNMDSPRNSQRTSFMAVPLSDEDLETGRNLLSPTHIEDHRRSRVGLAGSERPISGVSARSARSAASGGTVYLDANSSLPGTPLLSPLPRARTPTDPSTPVEQRWPLNSTMAPVQPPAYEPYENVENSTVRSVGSSSFSTNTPAGFDILDMPVPPALKPAIRPYPSLSSMPETSSPSSTVAARTIPFPPGLGTLTVPKSWADVCSGETPSPGSFAVSGRDESDVGVSIDILEDAPPSAGDGWRTLSSSGVADNGRRTTFGLFVQQQPEVMSEQGSLHSMRSHFGVPSSRSTGSAPASRHDMGGSLGSSNGGHSLARTGSISSDGRRRVGGGPVSPALSAFGLNRGSEQLSPLVGAPPEAYLSPDRGNANRALVGDEEGNAVLRPLSPGPSLQLANAPWAAGLDNDWTPA